MDKHALVLLRNEALWKEMGLTKCEAKHPGLVTSLLFHLISESQTLGGTFLNEFWLNLGKCHPRLQENIDKLSAAPELISESDVSVMLFDGIPAAKFNVGPIFSLAGEYFTHLGLAFMKPRDTLDPTEADSYDEIRDVSVDPDPYYVTYPAEDPDLGNDDLRLKLDVHEAGLSEEEILKYSALNRDGFRCVITGLPLQYPQRRYKGIRPSLIYDLNVERCRSYLATVIPISIRESPSALQCIASLAGDSTLHLVQSLLFEVDNAMVLEYSARFKFDELVWAVEALSSEKYVYRRIPTVPGPGPLDIKLHDGSEVVFGLAQDGKSPLPELCSLRLAVARVLTLSGAARLMMMLIEDPDVDTSREFREETPSHYYLQLACDL